MFFGRRNLFPFLSLFIAIGANSIVIYREEEDGDSSLEAISYKPLHLKDVYRRRFWKEENNEDEEGTTHEKGMKFRKMAPFFFRSSEIGLFETVPFPSHDDIFFIISKPPFYCGLALKMQFARKLPGFLLLA